MRLRFALTVAPVLLIASLSACSSSRSLESSTTDGSSPPVTASTTSDADTVTSAVPTTTTIVAATVPATVTTAPAPPTTTATTTATTPTTSPATVVTTVPGATGTPLGDVTDLHVDAGTIVLPATQVNCDQTPTTPGFTTLQCAYQPSYADGLVVLVQRATADDHFRVAVLFQMAGSSDYASRYIAEETEPGTWRDVYAVVGDFNGDDGAEAWIGYRTDGTGGYLDLDVLTPQPDGSVTLQGLQGLSKGVVHVRPGGADVVQAVFADTDPGCCPSSFSIQQVAFAAPQWVIDSGSTTPSAPPTASDFP